MNVKSSSCNGYMPCAKSPDITVDSGSCNKDYSCDNCGDSGTKSIMIPENQCNNEGYYDENGVFPSCPWCPSCKGKNGKSCYNSLISVHVVVAKSTNLDTLFLRPRERMVRIDESL